MNLIVIKKLGNVCANQTMQEDGACYASVINKVQWQERSVTWRLGNVFARATIREEIAVSAVLASARQCCRCMVHKLFVLFR